MSSNTSLAERPSGGFPDAELGQETHYSEPSLFHDKPPRLIVAINRVQTSPNRAVTGATIPGKDPTVAATTAEGGAYLSEILDTIAAGLEHGKLSEAWATDAGRPDSFNAGNPEEAWARAVSEMFTGSAYGGPDVAAEFQHFGAGDPPESVRKRSLGPTAYIYQRFQPEYVERHVYCTEPRLATAERRKNEDPAYSLMIACQHLSTYMLLARGFLIEPDMLGVGLSAGYNQQHPIFSDARGGKWVGVTAPPPKKPDDPKETSHGEKPLHAPYAVNELELGPGSVYCYDPYGAIQGRVFYLVASDLEKDDKGNVKYEKDKATGQNVPVLSAKRRTELWQADAHLSKTFQGDRDKSHVQYAGKEMHEAYQYGSEGEALERTPVFLRKIQADGSHIFGILRVEDGGCEADPDKLRVQAFDTSGSKWIRQDETVHLPDDPAVSVPALAASTNTGMFEGDWASDVYRGNHYIGVGIPPEAKKLAEMPAFLATARPVGLARLVVLARTPETYARPDANDILFASEYIRTYGDEKNQNYSIARFLLSLRNVPHYKSLRAFWILYAPRGKLAELMWAEGARKRPLDEMFQEVLAANKAYNAKATAKMVKKPVKQLALSSDLLPITVLSYDSFGLAQELWRNRLEGGGANGAVPRIVKQYFVDGGPLNMTPDGTLAKLGVAWNGEYVHPKIVDAGGSVKVPKFLRPWAAAAGAGLSNEEHEEEAEAAE